MQGGREKSCKGRDGHPVAGADLSKWIDWSDFEGAYKYVYGA